jgi:hypothetical protein
MLSLMFAAAEQQQGGKAVLVSSLECFALKLVRHSLVMYEGPPLLLGCHNKTLQYCHSSMQDWRLTLFTSQRM